MPNVNRVAKVQVTPEQRLNQVRARFLAKFWNPRQADRNLLLPGARAAIDRISNPAQLERLEAQLLKTIRNLNAPLTLDNLSFGATNGRLRRITRTAKNLDPAKVVRLEPIIVNGKFKLASAIDISGYETLASGNSGAITISEGPAKVSVYTIDNSKIYYDYRSAAENTPLPGKLAPVVPEVSPDKALAQVEETAQKIAVVPEVARSNNLFARAIIALNEVVTINAASHLLAEVNEEELLDLYNGEQALLDQKAKLGANKLHLGLGMLGLSLPFLFVGLHPDPGLIGLLATTLLGAPATTTLLVRMSTVPESRRRLEAALTERLENIGPERAANLLMGRNQDEAVEILRTVSAHDDLAASKIKVLIGAAQEQATAPQLEATIDHSEQPLELPPNRLDNAG